MHVFCPECNAEYKVNERSSLTKTVKFVCSECGNSWIDKFEKLEEAKIGASVSGDTYIGDAQQDISQEIKTPELNSLALDEVQNSFGNPKNTTPQKYDEKESDHIFQFETIEKDDGINNDGPSKTFPKRRNNGENTEVDQIQERDAKEIEIEKRLKESSELLKKAKQPQPDKKELVSKKGKSKRKVIILTFSILLLVCFFTYNLINLFLEDLLIRFPLVQKAYDQLDYYISIITGMFLILIESIMNSISNLG